MKNRTNHMAFLVATFLVFLALAPSPASSRCQEVEGTRFELVVLGRAQDGGLPHVGCNRPCCAEARETGRVEMPACLGVIDHEQEKLMLVEATPAIDAQIAMLQEIAGLQDRGRTPVDAVLLTHAHIGHYIGLAQLGREVSSTKELPVHLSPRFAEYLRSNGPWSQLVELEQITLEEFEPGGSFEPISGLRVQAVPVPHRDEFSDTMAYRIMGPNRTVLFVPDIDRWDADSVGPDFIEELMEDVDVAYVDGTFYDGRELPGRNLLMIPHPPIIDTLERFQDRVRDAPGSIRFIHLNHTNPVLHDPAIVEEIESRGFRVARNGERLGL